MLHHIGLVKSLKTIDSVLELNDLLSCFCHIIPYWMFFLCASIRRSLLLLAKVYALSILILQMLLKERLICCVTIF